MSKIIVNLTEQVAIARLETVLATFPHHPYRQMFAHPDIRQEAIAYILTRTKNTYITLEEGQKISITFDALYRSTWEKAGMEALICQAIQHVFHKNLEWMARHIPPLPAAEYAPSTWHG